MIARCFAVFSCVLLGACVQRDPSLHHGHAGADIVLTGAPQASPIAVGAVAGFRLEVANKGPRAASEVHLVNTVGSQSRLVSITCSAGGNATCPATLGASMLAKELPSGGTLDFQVQVQLINHGTGTILNSMSATTVEDPEPNDNVVTSDVLVR